MPLQSPDDKIIAFCQIVARSEGIQVEAPACSSCDIKHLGLICLQAAAALQISLYRVRFLMLKEAEAQTKTRMRDYLQSRVG